MSKIILIKNQTKYKQVNDGFVGKNYIYRKCITDHRPLKSRNKAVERRWLNTLKETWAAPPWGQGGHVPPPSKGDGDRGTRNSESTRKNSSFRQKHSSMQRCLYDAMFLSCPK